MTDLLTPSDADRAGDPGATDQAAPRRAFRAATLDEAVAAARAELGPEVELIEAHRVRRGGLGGFFATDLGVEIVAAAHVASPIIGGPMPELPTTPITPPLSIPAIQPVPATDPVLPVAPASAEVVTALDRLIQHAESIDRSIPIEHADRAPAPPMADDLDPLWLGEDTDAEAVDPTSFEAHLRSEMAAITTPRPDRATSAEPIIDRAPIVDDDSTDELDRPITTGGELATVDIWSDEPMRSSPTDATSDEIDDTDLVEGPLDEIDLTGHGIEALDEIEPSFDGIETIDEIEPSFDEIETAADQLPGTGEGIDDGAATCRAIPAALAPPSALLNPTLAHDDGGATDEAIDASIEELDALLREVGIMVDAIDAPAAPAPITMSSLSTIESLTRVAAEQLLDGVAALEQHSAERISRLSVSVTAPDGTTVSVTSDLLDPLSEMTMIEAPTELIESEGGDG